MPIDLRITAETTEEFDRLLARFTGPTSAPAIAAATAEAAPAAVAEEAKPAARGRGKKVEAAAPTQNPDGSPGGTDAPPAESIPPKQEAEVDAFAQPAAAEETAAPAASSPADQAAEDAGDVTIQQLKDAMSDLLKAKSASVAMQVLGDVSGCKSLTSGSPNVAEKSKEDPTLMRKVLDALVAAKAA